MCLYASLLHVIIIIIFTVGYTTNDVIYKWNGARQAVAIAEDMKLSQFDLVDCPAANLTDTIAHNINDDSNGALAMQRNSSANGKRVSATYSGNDNSEIRSIDDSTIFRI